MGGAEQEQRILAIPLICSNWERNWKELLNHGLQDYRIVEPLRGIEST
jgi:hypothetical protein